MGEWKAEAATLRTSSKRGGYEVGIELIERPKRSGGEVVIGGGEGFAKDIAELKMTAVGPARKGERDSAVLFAPIRKRIESIFWTCKDIHALDYHGARIPASLRVVQRFLALAACITLNHKLGCPSCALVDYVA
jgi:hypothetical protein